MVANKFYVVYTFAVMLPRILICLFSLFYSSTVFAGNYVYEYTDKCSMAYADYMALDLKHGQIMVLGAMKENPYNLMATYISDYEDCMVLLFNGDKKDFEQRYSHMDDRIELLSKGDESSPWYRFCKAGIYLHWALVHIRFGENFKAATTFRKSYLLLKENQKRFPQFTYNNVFFGLEEAIVGVIPDDYKWAAAIFGMRGNVKKGISKLDEFISNKTNNDPLRKEAVMYAIYLRFYLLSQQEEVWKLVNDNTQFSLKNNLLHQFVYANIAINYRKADAAIRTLKTAEANPLYKLYPIFDYEMGSALLNKIDPTSVLYLQSFTQKFNGQIFVKDAWQKIFYAQWLSGNTAKAQESKRQISRQGTTQVDADKQAQRFAEKDNYPDTRLLRARLLIDGGYYNNALNDLGKYSDKDFNNVVDKLEYYFRMGRIQEELGHDESAISCYKHAVAIGKDRQEYYAARSVLQMAFIYEKNKQTQDAINKYKECLHMKDHDFQNAIDQQAKAGINRLQ